MLGKRYIFCAVRFPETRRCCYYRTTDQTLQAGDIVIVPVGDENESKTAQVVSVAKYRSSEVPVPLNAAKFILRRARHREVRTMGPEFSSEQPLVVDISQRSVRTLFGYKMVPLTRREREQLRRQYERRFPNVVCIEKVPVPKEDALEWIDRYEDFLAMTED